MATTTLEIKISALVEGLKGVAELGAEFLKTAKSVKILGAAGEGFSDLEKGGTDAFKAITEEIEQTEASLEKIKVSGASFEEIGKATEAAEAKIESLKKKLDELKPHAHTAAEEVAEAFHTLGARSKAEIEAQIEQIKAALNTIKTSVPPVDDVSRAANLARAKIAALNHEMEGEGAETFKQRLGGIVESIEHADFKKAGSQINGLTEGLTGVERILGRVAIGFLAYKTLRFAEHVVEQLIEIGTEGAKAAAKLESLDAALGILGRNAGYSKESIEENTKAIEKMGFSSAATHDLLTRMIQSGVDINAVAEGFKSADGSVSHMTAAVRLAKDALDNSAVAGISADDSLNRLGHSLEYMSARQLAAQGIFINQEVVLANYATKLGTVASALTDVEKRQARFNALTEQSEKNAGAAAAVAETGGRRLQDLATASERFTETFGKLFAGIASEGAAGLGGLLGDLSQMVEKFIATTDTAENFKEGMKEVMTVVRGLGGVIGGLLLPAMEPLGRIFRTLGDLLVALYEPIKAIAVAVEGMTNTMASSGEEADALREHLNPLSGLLNGIGLVFALATDTVRLFAYGLEAVFGLTIRVIGAVEKLTAAVVQYVNVKAAEKLRADAKVYEDIGNALAHTAKEALNGKSATESFLDSMSGLGKGTSKTASDFNELSKEIGEFNQQQKVGKGDPTEQAAKYQELIKKIKESNEAKKIKPSQANDLTAQLQASSTGLLNAYDELAAKAKVKLTDLQSDITGQASEAERALALLVRASAGNNKEMLAGVGSSIKTISRDILITFDAVVSKSQTLGDLRKAEEDLSLAAKQGSVNQADLARGVTTSTLAFDKLLVSRTKSLETRDDFDKLIKQLKEFGVQADGSRNAFTKSQAQITESVQLAATALIDNNAKLATTKESVTAVIEEIKQFGKEGVFNSERVARETNKVTDAFIEARIKAAVTKGDFLLLADSIKSLGASGEISREKMVDALNKIAEAATGTRARIKELSDQSLALADEGTKISKASLDVATSEVDVVKKRVGLWVAQNDYARQGTDENRAAVEVARLDLVLAEQQLNLSRLKYKEESQSLDLLIEKQKLLNATKALEFDKDNKTLLAQKSQAEDSVQKKELALNDTKKSVDYQTNTITATQIAQVRTKGLLDNLKAVNAEWQKISGGAKEGGRQMQVATAQSQAFVRSMNAFKSYSNAPLNDSPNSGALTPLSFQPNLASIQAGGVSGEFGSTPIQFGPAASGGGTSTASPIITSGGAPVTNDSIPSPTLGPGGVDLTGARSAPPIPLAPTKPKLDTRGGAEKLADAGPPIVAFTGSRGVGGEGALSARTTGEPTPIPAAVAGALDNLIATNGSSASSIFGSGGDFTGTDRAKSTGAPELDTLNEKIKDTSVRSTTDKKDDAKGITEKDVEEAKKKEDPKQEETKKRIKDTAAATDSLIESSKNFGESATHAYEQVNAQIALMVANINKLIASQAVAAGQAKDLVNSSHSLDSGPSLPGSFNDGSTSVTPSFAEGGKIIGKGTGTSDDVLMWGSHGEYVVKAAAVHQYGTALLDGINSQSIHPHELPAFAGGGQVGHAPVGASGSPVGSVGHLELSFNKKALGRVTGSRETIKGLVDALKQVQESY